MRIKCLRESGHATPIQATFGEGRVGPKSEGLHEARSRIIGAGFHYPDNVSFTPAFFNRIIESNGLMKMPLAEAREKVLKLEFTAEEKKAIREAIMLFPELLRPHLMVRSDDYKAGVGIWYSGGASIIKPANWGATEVETLVDAVELQMKLVLASDFTEEAVVFKQKMGLQGHPGVQLMPVWGEYLNGGLEIAPRVSINYLGDVNGIALSAMGVGIGGANDRHASTQLSAGLPIDHFLCTYSFPQSRKAMFTRNGAIDVSPALEAEMAEFGFFREEDLAPASQRIAKLVEGQPGYAEAVAENVLMKDWVIVQHAPFNVRTVAEPSAHRFDVMLSTPHALGTKVVKTTKARFGENYPTPEDREFNARNNGHLLVINPWSVEEFMRNWSILEVCNAGAVVLHLTQQNALMGGQMFSSHLSGWLRELDIPVIAGNVRSDLIEGIQGAADRRIPCTVYADEFAQRGKLILGV